MHIKVLICLGLLVALSAAVTKPMRFPTPA